MAETSTPKPTTPPISSPLNSSPPNAPSSASSTLGATNRVRNAARRRADAARVAAGENGKNGVHPVDSSPHQPGKSPANLAATTSSRQHADSMTASTPDENVRQKQLSSTTPLASAHASTDGPGASNIDGQTGEATPANASSADATSTNENPTNTANVSERDLVQVFKLLADETRVKILMSLQREGELHVSALCARLGQSQPAVSHHLALLRDAGIIRPRRDGKHNYYSVRVDHFEMVMSGLFDQIIDRNTTAAV